MCQLTSGRAPNQINMTWTTRYKKFERQSSIGFPLFFLLELSGGMQTMKVVHVKV